MFKLCLHLSQLVSTTQIFYNCCGELVAGTCFTTVLACFWSFQLQCPRPWRCFYLFDCGIWRHTGYICRINLCRISPFFIPPIFWVEPKTWNIFSSLTNLSSNFISFDSSTETLFLLDKVPEHSALFMSFFWSTSGIFSLARHCTLSFCCKRNSLHSTSFRTLFWPLLARYYPRSLDPLSPWVQIFGIVRLIIFA